ncbi:alginate O-acetyltransferase AlgX-related protein [Paludisphaera rhizosphaerae]|uniref:alginate O-acetyltransferase AlgX-related protein n=1 Tax=Paludisphaera rhizosphaerae TaxID=2711216 RepID=UPI0013ED5E8F|nr:hypothetical protein [Paludisphaera rhizosphaerae]
MNDLSHPRPSNRRADVLLIVGVFAILVYPSLALIRDPAAKGARGENRNLQSRPPIHRLFSEPSAYVQEFRSFFEDQFAGRPSLVSMNSRARVWGLGVSTNPQVVLGKHGSLFYAGDPVVPTYDLGHEVVKQRRMRPLTDARVQAMHKFLLSRKAWAESLGAKFIFVVAPDKTTVYSEFTPDWMAPLDNPSVTDQFLDYLTAKGDVEFIDMRPALLRAKNAPEHEGKPLYYRDDTHWNARGAFVGYGAVTDRLQEVFPSIRALQMTDLDTVKIQRPGDLTMMLKLDPWVRERVYHVKLRQPKAKTVPFPYDTTPVPSRRGLPKMYQTDDASLPKALVFHDSYMEALMDFLAEDFRTSVFIWDHHVIPKTIGDYKPDVVLYEFVERNVPYMIFNIDKLTPRLDRVVVAEDKEAAARGRRR